MLEIPKSDRITGLPTLSAIAEYFEQLTTKQNQFGMLLLDIDRFQVFNACYGHQEGDEKLKQIASSLCSALPKDAKVFRSGGDEFVAFLSERQMAEVFCIATQAWNNVNQQLLSLPKLERSYLFPDNSTLTTQANFSVSCGVVFYPLHGKDFDKLREAENEAMYQSGKSLLQGVLGVAELK